MTDTLQKIFSDFDKSGFLTCVLSEPWKDLELKAKMRHVSRCLYDFLPEDYNTAVEIPEKAAPEIRGFDSMSLPDYVEQFGLDHPDLVIQLANKWIGNSENTDRIVKQGLRTLLTGRNWRRQTLN